MFRNLMRLMGWPVSGLGLILLLIVQSGATSSRFEPYALATSLFHSQAAPGSEAVEAQRLDVDRRITAEGRVVAYPGAEVTVGSEVAGRIISLRVEEKMTVRKGDLIAELNANDLKASLAEAEARIREAEADERHDAKELKREQELVARRAGTAQNLDALRHGLDAARARHAAAVAQRDRFAALIDKTRILAPIDGVVTSRYVHPGETIEAATRVITIVDLRRLRIEAEVDEYDAANVVMGANATIAAEGYSVPWEGRIEEIPDTVVGRKLRPEDPGRPVDARVLPVKIALSGPTPLKLGQRVEVQIAITGQSQTANPAEDHSEARLAR
jgi:HlyD family secretion protein